MVLIFLAILIFDVLSQLYQYYNVNENLLELICKYFSNEQIEVIVMSKYRCRDNVKRGQICPILDLLRQISQKLFGASSSF